MVVSSAGLVAVALFFKLPSALAACPDFQHSMCEGLSVSITTNPIKSDHDFTVHLKITDQSLKDYKDFLSSSGSVNPNLSVTLWIARCDSEGSNENLAAISDCISGKYSNLGDGILTGNITDLNDSYKYEADLSAHALPIIFGVRSEPYTIVGMAVFKLLPGVFFDPKASFRIFGTADLQVVADPEAGPNLNFTETETKTAGDNIIKFFKVKYRDAGSGTTLDSFSYDCGNDSEKATKKPSGTDTWKDGFADVFTCQYPAKTTQEYEVKVEGKINNNDNITVWPENPLVVKIPGSGQPPGPGGTTKEASDSCWRLGLTGVACFVNELFSAITGFFGELAYGVFWLLVAPLIKVMLSIHPYKDSFVGVIYPGWIVIRNLCNILFIVALIIIGLATLLRVESYQYKHLLVQLILAALMINFSLVIGQAVLGLADTLQAAFLPANSNAINNLGQHLMLQSNSTVWNFLNGGNTPNAAAVNGSFAGVVQSLFWLSLALGSLAVFAAIAIYLFIRMIALWILLLISPIAYACGILPSTASYRSQWWQMFLKYAFFAPIMAFFLNLTAVMVDNAKTNAVLRDAATNAGITNYTGSFADFLVSVGSNVLILIFLLASLMVAEKAGVLGASGITTWAKKGLYAPFQGAGFLAKSTGLWAKKRYDKKTLDLARGGWFSRQLFKATHPIAFVKAVRGEGKEERELYKAGVESGATEVARKQFGWRRKTESPMYLFDEHKGKELFEKEEGEWSDNEQQVMGTLNRLAVDAKKGDLRAQIKLKHGLREAFKHRNLNEAMEGENGLAKNFLGGKLNYNANNIRYFFQQLEKEGFIDKNFEQEFLKKLGKDGYETGDFNGVELAYSDPKTGHPHLIEMDAPVNGNAMPVGWSHYLTQRDRLINEADVEGRANAATAGITEPDQIALEIDKVLTKKENDLAKVDHKYANSMHAERGRRFMKINMSKKTGTAQVGMFHDSILNNNVVTGDVEVSDGGTEVLGHMDAGKMYAMGRDNMPAKTKDKFMRFISKVQSSPGTGPGSGIAKIENQLRTLIEANYRENGVLPPAGQIDKDVAEQRNLWLAAGYSILSSKPGATVMKDHFEDVNKIAQARIAGLSATDVRRYVKGEIPLPRALTAAEIQTAANQATIDTQDALIDEIMNFKK